MLQLPDHIRQTFFQIMAADIAVEAFEQWVYADCELEQLLPADDYLELISLNFKKSGARYELFDLLEQFVGAGEYEKWKLTNLLLRAKVRDSNLPGVLEEMYYLYCDGYDFLNTLGMGFGLSMCVLPKPNSVEHWSQLQPAELAKLAQSLPMLIINYEVDVVLRWLDEGGIILTGKRDENNRYEFIDNRTDAEKTRITQYKF